MKRPRRYEGKLFCYRCDGSQPEGTRRCTATLLNGKTCGSVAFYRVRRPGGESVPDMPKGGM